MLFVSGINVFTGRGFLQSHRWFLNTAYLCQKWRRSLLKRKKLSSFQQSLSSFVILLHWLHLPSYWLNPFVCVCRKSALITIGVFLFVQAFMYIGNYYACAPMCLCMRDSYLLTFVFIISIASAEQWSVMESRSSQSSVLRNTKLLWPLKIFSYFPKNFALKSSKVSWKYGQLWWNVLVFI